MSHQEMIPDPPFRSMVRASGAAEVWTDSTDDVKFGQFGWRCTNKESSYSNNTLIGNWSEERFDLEKIKKAECLPSERDHYFNSAYNSNYNTVPKSTVPKVIQNLLVRHSHAYPAHQPELDHDSMKAVYNSWKTTQRADYLNPKIRRQPVDLTK